MTAVLLNHIAHRGRCADREGGHRAVRNGGAVGRIDRFQHIIARASQLHIIQGQRRGGEVAAGRINHTGGDQIGRTGGNLHPLQGACNVIAVGRREDHLIAHEGLGMSRQNGLGQGCRRRTGRQAHIVKQ